MDIKGRTVFVTGGNTGMGKAIVLDLVAHGANAAIGYFDFEEEALQLVEALKEKQVKAKAYKLNIADEQNVIAVMKKVDEDFGELAALVNCAGVSKVVPREDLYGVDAALWDLVYQVNVKGTFFCIREAKPLLEKQGGCIVNMASTAGFNGKGSNIAYSCSKAAIINLTKSMAEVLAPRIRVCAVAPGLVRTNFTKAMDEERFARLAQETCMKRLVRPEEVAQVVGMLIYGNDIITGTTTIADGGRQFN